LFSTRRKFKSRAEIEALVAQGAREFVATRPPSQAFGGDGEIGWALVYDPDGVAEAARVLRLLWPSGMTFQPDDGGFALMMWGVDRLRRFDAAASEAVKCPTCGADLGRKQGEEDGDGF
jgi:hypothetical protein